MGFVILAVLLIGGVVWIAIISLKDDKKPYTHGDKLGELIDNLHLLEKGKLEKYKESHNTSQVKGRSVKIKLECPLCSKLTHAILPDDGAARGDAPDVKCETCNKVFKFTPGMAYKPIGYV